MAQDSRWQDDRNRRPVPAGDPQGDYDWGIRGRGYRGAWRGYHGPRGDPYAGPGSYGAEYRGYGPPAAYRGAAPVARGVYGLGEAGRGPSGPSPEDYAAGRRGPHRGRGPKGYKRADKRIHEEVCDRLMDDPAVDASDIEVGVKDGVVTLSGFVQSRMAKRHAEMIVDDLPGVVDVQNRLRRWQQAAE